MWIDIAVFKVLSFGQTQSLKNSLNLSYGENRYHHCFRRSLISKFSFISAQ